MKKLLVFLCSMIISITACFSLVACGNKYPTITFMDGDSKIVAVSSQEGLQEQLAKSITKEGNKFLGYFLDKECTKPFDVNNMTEEDFTLYVGWLALEAFNKISISADATLDVGAPAPMGLDADATVFYRETVEGIDLIVDAQANVAGVTYNAKIYYIDGFFAVGTSAGEAPLVYDADNIGTLKELIDDLLEDPQIKIVYDFVADILAKNDITIDANTLKQMFLLPSNLNINESVDIAKNVEGIIDAIIEIKDTPIYDVVLSALVPEDQIESAKLAVDTFLEELFDDEITIEGFINKLLDLVDLDIGKVLMAIDGLQETYKIGTQDVIDLINTLTESELPDAKEQQTITNYFSGYFNLEKILKTELSVLLTDIMGEQVKPSELLPMIKLTRDNTTVGTMLDLVIGLFDIGMDIDDILMIADSIVFNKLEFAAVVKTDANGLLTKLVLGTDDSITLGEDTYSVDVDLSIDLGYGLFGENIFVLPELAD